MSTTTVRILKEDLEKLNEIAKSVKMTQPVLIGYLVDMCDKYDMLEPDWIERLSQANYHELLLEADLDYKKGFEVAKYKATLNTQQMLIKELVKSMPTEDRVNYLKNVLGDPENDKVDLLEILTTQQMFSVNGQKKMYAPGQEGSPRIVGIPPTHLIQCPRGWHIKNDPCNACAIRKTCEIVFDERVDWLAINGTLAEQNEFINNSALRRRS